MNAFSIDWLLYLEILPWWQNFILKIKKKKITWGYHKKKNKKLLLRKETDGTSLTEKHLRWYFDVGINHKKVIAGTPYKSILHLLF